MRKYFIVLFLPMIFLIVSCTPQPSQNMVQSPFDADRAYQDVVVQMDFGPRTPGSTAHQKTLEYIQNQLEDAGWRVQIQKTTYQDKPVQNIIAKRGNSDQPIILSAHYDSRMQADEDPDPDLQNQPVPGANDGASGVAVLLEIARDLPKSETNVWLVFYDSEDQGRIDDWDWLLGSEAFADSLTVTPQAVIVIDMIGDSDLNVYKEKTSTQSLNDEIWSAAASLGYEKQFIDEEKYAMLDDHTPFLQKGIPAVDIIDFDYPYWHTTSDTIDKISSSSLKIIGNTLLKWITTKNQ